MTQAPFTTLILMWIIFAVVHSGLASGPVARNVGTRLGKYYRPLYSLAVLIVLLILIHYHYVATGTIFWHPHWVVKIIAAVLVLAAFAAIVVSLWKHALNYSGLATLLGMETSDDFERDGLHTYVRHPMYTGVLFLFWGVFIGYPYRNNLVSAVCFTLYCFIAIYFLERKLMAQYGEDYKVYRLRVPMLLPFI
ncbi:hypothetical protein GWC95_02180 [Sediminibacterium roseum]|uniref:NnrU domain-containing protein n=1 Tax=Sediminibacterium roseum TaxID=1978412 RepID=A0ABW9ZNQ1_9BACT|nr:NnrU family protein [Sediminibacterium roseum]NCI48715.1 hypothetical protein [Sediminibacterium roseum]